MNDFQLQQILDPQPVEYAPKISIENVQVHNNFHKVPCSYYSDVTSKNKGCRIDENIDVDVVADSYYSLIL